MVLNRWKNFTSLDLKETVSKLPTRGVSCLVQKAHSPTSPGSEVRVLRGGGPTGSHLWERECCHPQVIKAHVSGSEHIKDSTHFHVTVAGKELWGWKAQQIERCGDGAALSADACLTFFQEVKHCFTLQLEWHSLWVLRLTLHSHTARAHQYIEEARPLLSPWIFKFSARAERVLAAINCPNTGS